MHHNFFFVNLIFEKEKAEEDTWEANNNRESKQRKEPCEHSSIPLFCQ